jgi:ribonuclease T1
MTGGARAAIFRAAVGLFLVLGAGGFLRAAPANDVQNRIQEVAVDELPPEARATLELIKRGGPFPYSRDGTLFNNFEGRLPKRPRGYYREYTVPTPGARDRGARRIVVGKNGEYYYTADHYRTFRHIRF